MIQRPLGNLDAGGVLSVSGSRGGVDIDVVVEGDGKTIVTGVPTNTPRNPKGPK